MKRTSYDTSSTRLRYHEISTEKKSCKKLPVKSLVRFQCVSKQWSTIIGSRRDFIDSIVARSSESMRLIFHHQSEKLPKSSFFIFSSTYPQDPHKESISIPEITLEKYAYARGLILCWSCVTFSAAIYNPTTRQSLILPKIQLFSDDCLHHHTFLFGYDPVKNNYKVLCLVTTSEELENTCLVFTLRDRTRQWRKIQSGIEHHKPWLPAVCINDIIYYRATKDDGCTFFLVSFDVRSEKFSLVEAPKDLIGYKESTLINYHGKLGFVCYERSVDVWVMEDAGKQEWSMVTKTSTIECGPCGCGDEFVFVNKMVVSPGTVYVVYSNPKRPGMRLNPIQGTNEEERERNHLVHTWGVPNHVENTMCLY